MDNAFDKFLLDLEGEKNCLDLRRPAFNGSSEHVWAPFQIKS